ncbi:MAG: hypothetical protein JWM12_1478, partial [Ilumatobacteraceae bacterium]|nr:hypothetical protein [Ilumatobacteraceae bacterium]
MTRVLIASDESERAVHAARTAHQLFGDAAEYFVINVGFSPLTPTWTSGWGIATPVTMP